MTMLNFNSDQFLQLLTDALRAGPGSPAWHEALSHLREAGHVDPIADEYKLLLEARQDLESGKGYRQIRAGPEFTRKVLAAVAEQSTESSSGRGLPMPNIIAWSAGLVILGTAILVAWLLWNGGSVQRQTLAQLQSQTFSRTILSAAFNGDAPDGWRTIGSLKMSFDRELSPEKNIPFSPRAGAAGGGIANITPLSPDEPTALHVTLRLAQGIDGYVPQVFITDEPDFTNDRGVTSHALVWTLQPVAGQPGQFAPRIVLPDAQFGQVPNIPKKPGSTLEITLAFNSDYVVVDTDGQQVFRGPHQLSPSKPRYVGVRFLRILPGLPNSGSGSAVLSMKISK